MDALTVTYSGPSLSYISVTSGMNLQQILININSAINTMNPSPDYSGYNLYCVKQTDGVTHPTNTQNFAEGISKILCDFKTAYNTFTGTTYTTAISTLTTSINGVTSPALTYAPFSITSADTLTTVYSKMFTGFTSILNAQNPSAGNWSTLSITPPTTIVGGFNSLIAYISGTINANITTINNQLETVFDNSSNCLAGIGGTNTDDIFTTVGLLTTMVCSVPSFSAGSVTWGCLTSQSTLQTTIQGLVTGLSSVITNYVAGASTGLTLSTIGSCLGKQLAVDTSWSGLYKVMVNSSDTAPDFLTNKFQSGDSSITISTVSGNGKLNLVVNSTPHDGKVKVNSSDTTFGYLTDKLVPSAGDWGLTVVVGPSSDNSQLLITPQVTNPTLFVQNFITYVSQNPSLLSQWNAVTMQAALYTCTAPSGLAITRSGTDLVATWIAASSTLTQTLQFRVKDTGSWITGSNISPVNPLPTSTQTATISGLTHNTIYQFQVLSNCYSGTSSISNTEEGIVYIQQSLSVGVTGSTIINFTQTALPAISTIEYNLYDSTPTLLQTIILPGTSPTGSFTGLSSGNYTIKYRYGTVVNGVLLYSNDVTQSNAFYVTGTIVL